ncbi:MAG TPA: hypothetical protein VJT75_12195 [Thermoleophilaceae bacterium]|nr:hypothetical protein [Thermoleophilaceae bacterium]
MLDTLRRNPLRSRRAHALAIGLALTLTAAAPAGAAWHEPVPGPVYDSIGPSRDPSMTVIDGVPYVAWSQWDGTNSEIRVARLDAAGTAWEEVVGGESPINHSPVEDGEDPSLTSIGGVPYVAWSEHQGTDYVARVSRLAADGTAWEDVGGGASPPVANHFSLNPSITAAGGVPYVTWSENGNAIAFSRLNADGTAWEPVGNALPGSDWSSMATVDGIPYVTSKSGGAVFVARLNAAGTAFDPVGGAAGTGVASIASIGGVAYVASADIVPGSHEVRVRRLSDDETAWEEVGGGALNHSSDEDALEPSIAEIGGVPYVAWVEVLEHDFAHQQLRVSRLGASGTAWDEVVGGDNPFGVPLDHTANHPSLVGIGGVPYVAWEHTYPGRTDLRVHRLEPDFLAQGAIATDHEALMLSLVRTHGVPYPIVFQYGANGSLGRTDVTRTTADLDEDTVIQKLSGLPPDTVFAWRPVGFDGFRVTGAGPKGSFTTLPAPKRRVRLLVAIVPPRIESRAGRRVVVRYFATRRTTVTLELRRRGEVLAEVGGKAHVGRNAIAWDGRTAFDGPGRYMLVLKARTPDGQTAGDRVPLRIRRP